jgi:hypothetical protein
VKVQKKRSSGRLHGGHGTHIWKNANPNCAGGQKEKKKSLFNCMVDMGHALGGMQTLTVQEFKKKKEVTFLS